MAYGTAAARAYYGAGDYHSALALYSPGYYSAGGLFSFIGKAVKGVAKVAAPAISGLSKIASSPLGKLAASVIPGGSMIAAGASMVGGLMKGASPGAAMAGAALKAFGAPKQGQAMIQAGIPKAAPHLATMGKVAAPRPRRRRRKRRKTSRRRSPTRRRSRRRYSRGDYGDDWSGNTPSRDKSGRFLTRAGGRHHHHTQRRHHHRKHPRGHRVSFTTHSGRRVHFYARRGDAGDYAGDDEG